MFIHRVKEYLKFVFSLLKINFRLLRGMRKLLKLPQPAITIFGGTRIDKNSKYVQMAFKLSKMLTEDGFSIITGGGPGIMQAANRGAYEAAKEFGVKNNIKKFRITTVGIGLLRLGKELKNVYVHDYIKMEHFFSRKWLLVRYSIGFIVFPGGFGTMDELFEIITLIQCNRMPDYPIILIGKDYWDPMLNWIKDNMYKAGLINKDELEMIKVTNDIDEAFKIIATNCEWCENRPRFYSK